MTRCFPHVVYYEVIEFRYLESMNGLVVANVDMLRKLPRSFNNIIIIEQTLQTGSVCETGVTLVLEVGSIGHQQGGPREVCSSRLFRQGCQDAKSSQQWCG